VRVDGEDAAVFIHGHDDSRDVVDVAIERRTAGCVESDDGDADADALDGNVDDDDGNAGFAFAFCDDDDDDDDDDERRVQWCRGGLLSIRWFARRWRGVRDDATRGGDEDDVERVRERRDEVQVGRRKRRRRCG
jgi:hypothetical protein